MNEILEAFETDEYRNYCKEMLDLFPRSTNPRFDASYIMFHQVNSLIAEQPALNRPKHRDAIRIAAMFYWIGGKPEISAQFIEDVSPKQHDLDPRIKAYIGNLIRPSDSKKLDYKLVEVAAASLCLYPQLFDQISYMIWLRDFGHFRLPLGFQTFLEKIGD